MSDQTTTQKPDVPYIPVNTVVTYTDLGKVRFGKIIGGTANSIQIEEIVPINDGARKPDVKEYAKWEFKGNVYHNWTRAAERGMDLRSAVDKAYTGIHDSKILAGFDKDEPPTPAPTGEVESAGGDPGDEHQETASVTFNNGETVSSPAETEKAPEPEPEPANDPAPEPEKATAKKSRK